MQFAVLFFSLLAAANAAAIPVDGQNLAYQPPQHQQRNADTHQPPQHAQDLVTTHQPPQKHQDIVNTYRPQDNKGKSSDLSQSDFSWPSLDIPFLSGSGAFSKTVLHAMKDKMGIRCPNDQLKKCLGSMGGVGATCAVAAMQFFRSLTENAKCSGSLTGTKQNMPKACIGCQPHL